MQVWCYPLTWCDALAAIFCAGGGKVLRWRTPANAGQFDHQAGIRVDSGVSEGDSVGTNYDPMIAKIITHAEDRETALQLLRQALAETQVCAVAYTLLLRSIDYEASIKITLTIVFRCAAYNTAFGQVHVHK
eukprot:GHRR01005770.1.p1 GENE.GHRR01005770.1~~GHRR01005770.1.p1  ORF type:complete len:132 (+),score=31.94 GHRR01005770.1:440-835(+)